HRFAAKHVIGKLAAHTQILLDALHPETRQQINACEEIHNREEEVDPQRRCDDQHNQQKRDEATHQLNLPISSSAFATISSRIASPVRPRNSLSGFTIKRCASVSGIMRFTSSGIT